MNHVDKLFHRCVHLIILIYNESFSRRPSNQMNILLFFFFSFFMLKDKNPRSFFVICFVRFETSKSWVLHLCTIRYGQVFRFFRFALLQLNIYSHDQRWQDIVKDSETSVYLVTAGIMSTSSYFSLQHNLWNRSYDTVAKSVVLYVGNLRE